MEKNAIYTKRVLNSDEASEFLGIKKRTLWSLTSGGIIPYSKPNGKHLFFERVLLEEWMLRNASPGRFERDAQAVTYITKK
jgi:prophage regulatory protein